MTRLFKLTIILAASTLISVGCATVEIPNIKTYVTLPYSGDGHSIETLTHKEDRIPKAEWEEKRKRGIILFSEDWQKLKFTLLKNCEMNECKQSVGALDGLFQALDDALGSMPGVK